MAQAQAQCSLTMKVLSIPRTRHTPREAPSLKVLRLTLSWIRRLHSPQGQRPAKATRLLQLRL